MNLRSKIVFPVFSIQICLVFIEALWRQHQTLEDDPFWHKITLDPRGKYQLKWRVHWSRETVEFNVTAKTRGYVALGLSRNGEMVGSDIVIGGMAQNGIAYMSDRHATGNQEPLEDPSQDWVLHSASESRTHTFLSFSRSFDTCDDEHDIPINDDAVYILWAYGKSDNISQYHFENRGSYLTYLRDPDLTPRTIHESNENSTSGPVERVGDALRGAVRTKFLIPPKRTTYWCNVHKFSPVTPGKKHIIGYNVKINPEAIQNMHHMMLRRCRLPPGVNPASVFEKFVGKPGQECYNPSHLHGPIPAQYCSELKGGFAIGVKPIFLPDHVGVPIGETNSDEYFIWQVHYDNPHLRTDIYSDIQMDIYYTSNLRTNDGGIISIGHNIVGAPSLLLPPGEMDHKIFGHCGASCTRKMLPPQGIKIFAGLLHTHTAGRRIRIQHFRNGNELPWILNDDNYRFQFQPLRLLHGDLTVLPGDQISVQCYYDTTYTNKTTIGGYGTDQEMCKAFISYHMVLENYPFCRSEIISKQYMMRYLAGTENVTWDESRLEYMATEPLHLEGMTLSGIADSQYVTWDDDLRMQLKRDHVLNPQQAFCPSLEESAMGNSSGVETSADYVSFPVGAKEYVPPKSCPFQKTNQFF